MRKRILTNEQDAYLRSIALGKSAKECKNILNNKFGTIFTERQIITYKSNHSICSGKKPHEFANHSKQKITTHEQDVFISQNFKGIRNDELTNKINEKYGTSFTSSQIKNYKRRHKLNSGLTSHFKKGDIPANKGKKFPGKTNITTFKKGNMPKNTDRIGTEKLLADGYIWVKINNLPNVPKKTNWCQKHIKIWQDKHGPVPKGHVVIFLDGDHTNFEIDNLKMISQSVNLCLNKNNLRYDDKKITEFGVTIAELITTIFSTKKGE